MAPVPLGAFVASQANRLRRESSSPEQQFVSSGALHPSISKCVCCWGRDSLINHWTAVTFDLLQLLVWLAVAGRCARSLFGSRYLATVCILWIPCLHIHVLCGGGEIIFYAAATRVVCCSRPLRQ